MALSTQPYKGARDFYPEDKRLQKYLFSTMRNVAERFGYEEYDAPILEPTELYLSKGNQEIIEEQTYTFLDRGERSVTIRTEMTPTVSRMVAGQRQELAYPVRWYSIPNLWRYERTQRGRLREFWQLNIDIFGVADVTAEHELIVLADQLLKAYGAKPDMYDIRIASRALTDYLLREYLLLDEVQAQMIIKLIDRMQKITPEEFDTQAEAILTPSQREAGVLARLKQLLAVKRVDDLPVEVQMLSAAQELGQLFELLEASRVTSAKLDLTIVRGFDYYTGIVFEVSDTDPENNRSMFGGGRYDGLVGAFGVEPVPTVGFGMGDVTLQNFLESHQLLPALEPETDARVLLIGDVYQGAQAPIAELRKLGIRVAVDSTGRKFDKQIKAADKSGVRYVLIIGEQELADGRYRLKDLRSGNEEVHSMERIVSLIKDYRRTGTQPDDRD